MRIVRAILTRCAELDATADARLVILALCAVADEDGRARLWTTSLAELTGLSKRRLDRVVEELGALGFIADRSGKKGAKTTFDLSALADVEKDHCDLSQVEERSHRSFSKKDHSGLSQVEKDHSGLSSRRITVGFLENAEMVEKAHSDLSQDASRKITVGFLEAEKDHCGLSSRASERAQQQQHLSKKRSGSTRGAAEEQRPGVATKNAKKARTPKSDAAGFLSSFVGEEPRNDKERLSAQDRSRLDAIEADSMRRIELQREAQLLLERPDLPLDAFLSASFAAYQRAITPGAAGGLASRLLSEIKTDALVRDYVLERLIEHDSGTSAERYGDKGFTSFVLRDAARWAAERAERAAIVAASKAQPEALPRLKIEPEQDATAETKLTDEEIENVSKRLRLH